MCLVIAIMHNLYSSGKVATCKFLAAFTKVPVPRIYTWNSDPSNPVGAEYMIMDKV